MSYQPVYPMPAPPVAFAQPVTSYGSQLVATSSGSNWDDMSTGGKALVVGIGALLVGGIGWLIYKKTQLYHKIAEKEGSTGVIKLTAADTASTLLTHALLRDRR
jgi:hypothetical protein